MCLHYLRSVILTPSFQPAPDDDPLTFRMTKCPSCHTVYPIKAESLNCVIECACHFAFDAAEFVHQKLITTGSCPYTHWKCTSCHRETLIPALATHFPGTCPCGQYYPFQPKGASRQELEFSKDANIGNDPSFVGSQLVPYRAAQQYHYDFKNLADNQYAVTNPTKGTSYSVTLGQIGQDSCECNFFRQNRYTCIHIEHIRLRLGLPSPSLDQQIESRGIYAWFDKSAFPARIKLGCIGDTETIARRAAQDFLAISDHNSLTTIRDRVEKEGVPFRILWSAQLALNVPAVAEVDFAIGSNIALHGRSFLSREFPQLREHQINGAMFLATTQRALLLDEMGLGKTLQAIAAARLLHKFAGMNSCLIVCPKSVMDHWSGELRKFAGEACTVIEGDAGRRRRLYSAPTLFKIVTIESLRRDFPEIGNPDLIIVDEVQKLRSVTTLSNRVIQSAKARFVFGLSGTAIEAGLADLYGILTAMRAPDLESPLEFFASYMICNSFGKPVATMNPEFFFVRHADYILRRLKAEVEPHLPELNIAEVDIDLSPLQAEMAAPLLDELKTITDHLKERYDRDETLRSRWLINRIVEVSDSTSLLDPTTNDSSKLLWLRDYLNRGGVTDADKLVIFTRWTRCQDLICNVCDEIGVGCVTLRGEHSLAERKEAIERFKDDSRMRVFISTDAGGVGINLQFARKVLIFEPSWNPSTDAQRIQRVHRIGQTLPVDATYLLTWLDRWFVQSTHGKKQFASDAIDAVRSPLRNTSLPTWPELCAVIQHYHDCVGLDISNS